MANPNKRKRHEHKTEQKPGFKSSYVASTRGDPKIRAGNADREPWMRFDERESEILTGRYRHYDDQYYLLINQAGSHIEMLLTLVESGAASKRDDPADVARSRERMVHFGGDVSTSRDGYYDLYIRREGGFVDDKELACGHLRSWTSGALRIIELDLDLGRVYVGPGDKSLAPRLAKLAKFADSRAKRFDESPSLLPQHLEHPWILPEVRTMHWFPLTPTQKARLMRHILDVRITLRSDNYQPVPGEHNYDFSYIELLRHYAEPDGDNPNPSKTQKTHWRVNIARALNDLVLKAQHDAMTTPAEKGGIDSHHQHHWRDATLESLHKEKIEIVKGSFRSLLTLTQDVLDSAPTGALLDHFRKLLFLERATNGHEYTAKMTLIDLDGAEDDVRKVIEKVSKRAKQALRKLKRYPVGGFAGALTVRKLSDGPFTANYMIVIGGLKLSASAGTSFSAITSPGKAERVYGRAWRPEHIPGVAAFREMGGSILFGGGGKGASGTILRCHGTGPGEPDTPLQINFSGFSDLFTAGAGTSVSAMLYWGKIFPIDADGGDVMFDLPQYESAAYRHEAMAGLHFPINCAALTDQACTLLRIFAASELAVLSRPGVTLELHGYADQPHDVVSNEILSRNRAMSVYNYLKNIIGKDLVTPELEDIPSEKDEMTEAKKPRESNEAFEIADASAADGSVIVVPHGEPQDQDESGEAEYDQELRRVDLKMNGELRLTLRRVKDD